MTVSLSPSSSVRHQGPALATGTEGHGPVWGGKEPGLGAAAVLSFIFVRLIQTLPSNRVPAPPAPQHPRPWGGATTSPVPRGGCHWVLAR